jgi:hypothetical protein
VKKNCAVLKKIPSVVKQGEVESSYVNWIENTFITSVFKMGTKNWKRNEMKN